MLLKKFSLLFLQVSAFSVSGCTSVAPPLMETCVVEPSTNSLACSTHTGKRAVRTLIEANNYVCFPSYDFKMYAEFCHK